MSLGGDGAAVELPADVGATWRCERRAAVGADYAGVDLLPSRDGTVFVLEVNGIPGWQGLQQATGHRCRRRDRRPPGRGARASARRELASRELPA